jgi:molecular chaperone GrpE
MHEEEQDETTIEPLNGTEIDTEDADIIAEEDEQDPQGALRRLRAKLKQCSKERQEYLTGWQRSKADFVNARKQDEDRRQSLGHTIREEMIADLLPVLDSFQMAFSNKEAWEKAEKNWRMGVEYIYAQLINALAGNGLEEYDPTGETFDPEAAIAIESVPVTDPTEDHRVLSVAQKGYRIRGRIIRPAKVKVGSFEPKENR